MWTLDPANSPDLMKALAPHWRRPAADVAWVGEGWRHLVEECHRKVSARFPDYELLNIKQKYGVLAFLASPRPWSRGTSTWTDEALELEQIIREYTRRSESTCEYCGAAGELRDSRTMHLTLCDRCDARFSDPRRPGQD